MAFNKRLPSKKWMRPTTSKTRESLLATLAPYIEPTSKVLDLFAGTGSLGLALLEEGCQEATFVEGDRRSLNFLRENVGSKGKIICGLLPQALQRLAGEKFDIIVADPPYNSQEGPQTLLQLGAYTNEGGIIVFEYHHKEKYPEDFKDFKVLKSKRFGETALTFWQKIKVED
ncbi:RsmD family RNA methyltransferase [bacterium]|nr:RsmD family RNA methyltransferase [bacterium]